MSNTNYFKINTFFHLSFLGLVTFLFIILPEQRTDLILAYIAGNLFGTFFEWWISKLLDQDYTDQVKIVSKEDSRLMKCIAFFIKPFCRDFMTDYFTTIGNTIYIPDRLDPHTFMTHFKESSIVQHEMVHIRQFYTYGIFKMALFYVLFPLPFFLSGRWFIERYAYLTTIKITGQKIDDVVNNLWHNYGMPWPRSSMKKWFEQKLREELSTMELIRYCLDEGKMYDDQKTYEEVYNIDTVEKAIAHLRDAL